MASSHPQPSIQEIRNSHTKLTANAAIKCDLESFLAEVLFAMRKRVKNPIAWAETSAKTGKFLAKPDDCAAAAKMLKDAA